jgi:hypothetical protein
MTRLRHTITAAAATMAAAAVLACGAAQAGEVLLWACHGPGGEALGDAPFVSSAAGDGIAGEYGGGCAQATGAGGLSATFSRPDPAGGSKASWQLAVPAGVTLASLRLVRATSGFGGVPVAGDPQSYRAQTSSMSIEFASLQDSSDVSLSGELSLTPVEGRFLRLGVDCELPAIDTCASPPEGTVGVDVSSIALGVLDSTSPTGGLTGVQSPIAGTLRLLLDASDTGLGLASAEASLDERVSVFVRLGEGSCPERPVAGATIDLRLGAECPGSVSGVPLLLDTRALGDGRHQLRVRVTDAAGNTTMIADRTVDVRNGKTPSGIKATVTLGVGGLSAGGPGAGRSHGGRASHGGENGGNGGVRGFSAANGVCRAPRLFMRLASKPLRYARHHVPVLRARRRYRYRGRLTCLMGDRRVSAPTGTVVRVLYRIGRHTHRSGRGTMTVHRGRLRALLGYRSDRTIIFRYRARNGEIAQVKIRVRIACKRRKALGGRGRR